KRTGRPGKLVSRVKETLKESRIKSFEFSRLIRETVDRPMRIQYEPRINPCRGVRAGLFLFIDIFSIKEKIWGGGGRKLTTAFLVDAKKNNIVKGLLFRSIPEDLEARLQTLVTKFENLKMSDNGTIYEYVAKFSDLEKVLDLKTTRFEDVVGRLKAYEERVREEDKANDAHENLHYARTEYSNENNDSRRGRGRGSYSHGCGHGQVNLNKKQEENVYHEEGTFFMMKNVQKTIFMNEEKYIPPKIESNTEEDDEVLGSKTVRV
nr:hypothetical protein [Tanacetum cinerariifolium]